MITWEAGFCLGEWTDARTTAEPMGTGGIGGSGRVASLIQHGVCEAHHHRRGFPSEGQETAF